MLSRWIWGRTLEQKSCLFGGFAASIGFYLILSIAPFLAVVIGLSTHFFQVDLTLPTIDILQHVLPPESKVNAAAIVSTVSSAVSGGVLTLTFIFAFLTTHSFMHSLVRALRYIFSTEQQLPKTNFQSTITSLALLILWSLVFSLFSLFLLLTPIIEIHLSKLHALSHTALLLWNLVRYAVTFLFIWVAIHFTYQLTDANRHPVSLRLQSSLLTAVSWLLLSFAFSNILPALWSASILHGALGGLVAMLVWAHATAWVLILGACLAVRRHDG
ncbi:MAG: YhjD/YihY/BrkB family envelope integrity protein [Blastochloris sp.]|jgi:membrane protein|nr:YhjD/YihY/BrkB family envelope integrity protein [Blastochloris sp.]